MQNYTVYRITHVTATFWRIFTRYTYVSEKFNLNWYNGGIVYNTSMKMKKKILRFLLLWDNILSSFGRTLDSTHFFNVIIQLLSCLWQCKISVRFEGFFFAVYWNLTTLRSFSKVESVGFFSYLLLTLF